MIAFPRRVRVLCDLSDVCARLEVLASGCPCDLVPAKDFPGTGTVLGDLCRVNARLQYLVDVLKCEMNGSVTCCQDAADDYCTAFDKCPD